MAALVCGRAVRGNSVEILRSIFKDIDVAVGRKFLESHGLAEGVAETAPAKLMAMRSPPSPPRLLTLDSFWGWVGRDPVVLDALIVYIHFRGIKIPPRKHGRKQDPNIWDVQFRIQQIQGNLHPTEASIPTMSVDIFV